MTAAPRLTIVPGEGEAPGEAKLPTVEIVRGQLLRTVEQIEAHLAADPNRSRVFQQNGTLVRVARVDSGEPRSGVTIPQGTLCTLPVNADRIAQDIQRVVVLRKRDGRTAGKPICDPPADVCRALLQRAGDCQLPTLVSVSETPTLRGDGSMLDQPGFDEPAGIFYDPGDTTFPPVPSAPSREDALRALSVLAEVIEEFPFVTPAHRSVALSAMLTVVVRPMLRAAPAISVTAPAMGSGKTLIAIVLGYMANGRMPAVMTVPRDDEEFRKRALAIFSHGSPVVVLDNISRPFESDVLCSVLTSPTFTDRVLGNTKNLTLSTAVLWVLTGNNLSFVGDLTTRVLPIELDPGVERPETRSFRRDLHDYVPRMRPTLITAALTILRAFVVAGWPRDEALEPFGRFEQWDQLVRSALVWLGQPDPIETRREIEEADPIRNRLRTVLEAWYDHVGIDAVSVMELLAMADIRDPLKTALLSVAEERNTPGLINKKTLAYFLRSSAKRIQGELRLMPAGRSNAGQRWMVQKVTG